MNNVVSEDIRELLIFPGSSVVDRKLESRYLQTILPILYKSTSAALEATPQQDQFPCP